MVLVKIGSTDITKYINTKTYKMNAEQTYESWEDANYHEHRIYTRDKVVGTFEIVLFGLDNMDTDAFLTLWNNAVDNHLITLKVFVQNTNETEREIEAYYEFDGTFHRELVNGTYIDKLTVNISER